MHPALWVAKSGLDAQDKKTQVIANNLANINTTGFKRDRAEFENLLYQNIRQPGAQTAQDTEQPMGLMLGSGVKVVATRKIHTPGDMVQTDNALDLSIDGRGFLQVAMPDGTTAYTRNGSLSLDQDGNLVTAGGYAVEPAITVPQGALSITIARDGQVSVMTSGSSTPTNVGQLQIADFINPTGLQPLGENLLIETVASGTATVSTPGTSGLGSVVQGTLENSNVNAVEEMVDMITTQRAYESTAKAVSTADQMLQYANNNL